MESIKNTDEIIENIIDKMTLEEKVALCHANSKFTSAGVKRLGIDDLCVSDGPHGIRPDFAKDSWTCLNRPEDNCTYLPTETALAATWNPKLARLFGEILGSEARYRGKDIILGPGINIIRNPLCGRNFEYMSEDPCLIEYMVPELIKGIESQDIAACVKHFALNNQELDRGYVNVEVSKRALNEIYLRGFYAAITKGEALAVMGAYNRYQNQYCCHNKYLVNDILKNKWKFKGAYISDWAGVHNTDEAIFNGTDLEFGTEAEYDNFFLGNEFLKKAEESKEVKEILDDKVKRILRLMKKIGKLDGKRKQGEFNTPEHQKGVYKIASEAVVLLKNEKNLLPLNIEKGKTLLVVGENAITKHSSGGGSSGVNAYYEITPLEGITERIGDKCIVEYDSGICQKEYYDIPLQNMGIADFSAGCRGCIVDVLDENAKNSFILNSASYSGGIFENYEISLPIEIPSDGSYSFMITSTGNTTVSITGDNIKNILSYKENIINSPFECNFDCLKNESINIKLKIKRTDDCDVSFSVRWLTPEHLKNISSKEALLEKAKKADYVVFFGGLNHSFDTEGCDRTSLDLPSAQNELISDIAKVNKSLIVAITAGSPVTMPWIDNVKSVIWNWYGGMEIGYVISDVLTGDICPSGKMPFTLPKRYEDCPVAIYGEYSAGNCKYNEDIFVGYRSYDYNNIEPLFPFGFGLSYSEFAYKNLSVCQSNDCVLVTFSLENIGKVKAMETAQLYVGARNSSVIRPKKELKQFEKVELKPNESKEITLRLNKNDFCFFDEELDDWKFEEGIYDLYLGSSSLDIRLKKEIELK